MEKPITETMMTKSTGRPPIYRVQTGDGCWYRISEEDYHRLNQAKGIGCMQLTVLPGHEYIASNDLNIQRYSLDDPEALEARVAKAKAEIAALTEKLATAHKLLTDALGGAKCMDTKEFKTYRLSDDAMTPNLRLILDVVPGMVTLYEADMTSRRAEAQETEVYDKILMSPADARWLRDALNSADLSDPPGWNAPGGAK